MSCFCGRPSSKDRRQCDPCLARNRRYAAKRSRDGLCKCCNNPAESGGVCSACRIKRRESNTRRRRRVRQEALQRYGGSCACCGETTQEFLAIDHPKGNGREERQRYGGGSAFYQWLKTHGWPKGYRVLCHNCNLAIGFYGACPHQR